MSDGADSGDDDVLGLVGCIAVEFPDGTISGDGFAGVLDLVERNVVRILDLEFVTKRADDSVAVVAIGELDGVDLAAFDGASSGVLDRSDLEQLGASIAPGSVAAFLVYEERSLVPVIAAWRAAGARIVADNVVAPDELLAALDATESAETDLHEGTQ